MFSPLSIGTALGGFTSGFLDAQKQLQQRQAQMQQMQIDAQRLHQAQQAQSLAFPALLGLGGAGGGGVPQLPSGDAPPVPGGGGDTGARPAGLDGGAQPPMPGASSQPNIGGGPKIGGAGEGAIIQRESGGKPNVGYGGADLSNAPLDQYGFPQWSGKMGPQGISHAAGLYQFEPATWREGAQAVGVHDFSADSQKKVYDYIRGKYGETPWAASAPGGGGGGGQGEASPQQIAHNAQRQIPPQQWGQLSIQQLAQSIERANPAADPAVKMMALETASKLLAPMQQQQWEQYKFGIEEQDKLRIHEDTLANQRLQHEETSAFRSAMLNNRVATQQKPIPEKDEDGTTYLMYPPDQPGGKPRYTTLEGDEYHPKGMVKVGTSTQTINPEAQKMMADGIAKYQLPPLTGWALKSSAGQQIMADVLKQNPQYDATKFTGKAAGARSVGTRSAQLEMNTDVAEQEIPLTLETSRKIDRTEFPTINSMVIAVEKGTGNPDVIKFLDQLNALKYTYAAALSRTGTNTVDAMRRFDQILDPAWSQGQIEAALEQFKATLGAERRGIDKSRGLGGEASPQTVPQPGTVQDGYRFKGGDPAQESNWERVQ